MTRQIFQISFQQNLVNSHGFNLYYFMGLFELVVCECLHCRRSNANPGYQPIRLQYSYVGDVEILLLMKGKLAIGKVITFVIEFCF